MEQGYAEFARRAERYLGGQWNAGFWVEHRKKGDIEEVIRGKIEEVQHVSCAG